MKSLLLVLFILYSGNVLCDEWGYKIIEPNISGEKIAIKGDEQIFLNIKNPNWECKITAFNSKDPRNYRTLECINKQNLYVAGILLECNSDYNSETLYLSPKPYTSKDPHIFIEINLYCTNTESQVDRKARLNKRIDNILEEQREAIKNLK